MIEIILEEVNMPTNNRKYQKFKDKKEYIWHVLNMETEEEVFRGNYKNASLACLHLNKKHYKETLKQN